MSNFSKNLKQLRKGKNLTQTELAKRLNKSRATIAAYETDVRQPDIDTLISIAKLFGVSLDDIIGDRVSFFPMDLEDVNYHRRLASTDDFKLVRIPNPLRLGDPPDKADEGDAEEGEYYSLAYSLDIHLILEVMNIRRKFAKEFEQVIRNFRERSVESDKDQQ